MLDALEIKTFSEGETLQLGATIGKLVRPEDVIYLIGDLGTGKTRLAKGIISAAAGIPPDEIVSPTFTLINRFEGVVTVNHADLYRIEPHEVQDIGLEDFLEQGEALIIEWAEKIQGIFEDPLEIVIFYGDDPSERRFLLKWRAEGSWNDRVKSLTENLFSVG